MPLARAMRKTLAFSMGQAAGLIREVEPVGRLLEDMVEEAGQLMAASSRHVAV